MYRQWTAIALAAMWVAGCGGGGGDDEPALTAITDANAQRVSSVVYKASSALFDVAISGPLGEVIGVVTDAP